MDQVLTSYVVSTSWLQHEVPWPAEACEGHSHGPAAAVSTLRAVSSCKHRAGQLLSSLSKHFLFQPISLDESSWYLHHVFFSFLSLQSKTCIHIPHLTC